MSNKMAIVTWFDDDTVDTIHIAAKEYGLDILATKPTENADEIEVCIYGPVENVDRFVEDNDEGDIAPFNKTIDLDDIEYQDWLANQLSTVGFLYIPNYTNDEDLVD